LKNLKAIHFDFTPLRFVTLNVTFNVILSADDFQSRTIGAMRSGATNEVEVYLCFLKPTESKKWSTFGCGSDPILITKFIIEIQS